MYNLWLHTRLRACRGAFAGSAFTSRPQTSSKELFNMNGRNAEELTWDGIQQSAHMQVEVRVCKDGGHKSWSQREPPDLMQVLRHAGFRLTRIWSKGCAPHLRWRCTWRGSRGLPAPRRWWTWSTWTGPWTWPDPGSCPRRSGRWAARSQTGHRGLRCDQSGTRRTARCSNSYQRKAGSSVEGELWQHKRSRKIHERRQWSGFISFVFFTQTQKNFLIKRIKMVTMKHKRNNQIMITANSHKNVWKNTVNPFVLITTRMIYFLFFKKTIRPDLFSVSEVLVVGFLFIK